jgi:2-polyprenyl-6-methoxyphenol hydroxylase-like FAD-dependent oxidoreductase
MLAQDGDRWVVTVGGYLGEHAPSDTTGFLKAVKALPKPDIYRIIKEADALHDPDAYTFPANLRRRYDKLQSFPQGYLIIGDALCSFNPIYGQGMTVAALEAHALDEQLSENKVISAKSYFAKVSKIIAESWDAAVGTDLSFSEVEGQRTPLIRFLNWYFSKLHIAAHTDADVSVAFLKVINMMSPPPSILHPRIIWRVLQANWRSGQPSQSKEPSWSNRR